MPEAMNIFLEGNGTLSEWWRGLSRADKKRWLEAGEVGGSPEAIDAALADPALSFTQPIVNTVGNAYMAYFFQMLDAGVMKLD